MIAPTRRGLLAGALAGLAVPAVARASATAAAGPLQAEQKIVRRGRAIAVSRDGRRAVVAHDARRTIAIVSAGRSRLVDVGGQPLEVAISRDGRLAAVTTAFWDEPGLALVDVTAGTVRERVKAGPAPWGVAFTPDDRRLVVTGGEQEGALSVFAVKTLALVAHAPVGIVPRGVDVDADGKFAWVALNGDERLVRVDLRTGRVRRTLRTPARPERVALSPDGRRLLVTHTGPGADDVSELVVRTGRLIMHRAGRQPTGVAWSRRGRRVVALGGAGEILVLAGSKPVRRARRQVGGAPRGVAVAGERAWTVDGLTGRVDKVRA